MMKKLITVFVLTFLLSASPTYAAIAFVQSGRDSLTTLAGSNLGVVWAIQTTNTTTSCSPVTYGGQTMTQAQSRSDGNFLMQIYYLIGAPTGTNSISKTSCGENDSAIAAYSGVGGYDFSNYTSQGGGTTISNSLTTIFDNDWVIGFAQCDHGGTCSASTGVTQRNCNTGFCSGDSNGAVHPAGSYSMTFNSDSNGNNALGMFSFCPLNGCAAGGFINGLHWNIQWLWK